MIKVRIHGIRHSPTADAFVVVLQNEADEKEIFLVWVGSTEAAAIIQKIKNTKMVRPSVYDLFSNLLNQINASVIQGEITHVEKGTYHARLTLKKKGSNKKIELDLRPSDLIAICLHTNTPIMIADKVMEKYKEKTYEILQSGQPKQQKMEEQDPNKIIDKFREDLKNITPEDFKKTP